MFDDNAEAQVGWNGRTKFAIVGASASSIHLAPYYDDEWVICSIGGLFNRLPVFGLSPVPYERIVWFEIHHRKLLLEQMRTAAPPYNTQYLPWLRDFSEKGGQLIMRDEMPEIPLAVPFDREAAEELCDGLLYFTNSISYMIAWALLHGATEMGFWGVDMMMADNQENQEYSYQRSSCEWWMGIARGMGVKLIVPDECDMLKTAYQYGDREESVWRTRLRQRYRNMIKNQQNAEAQAMQTAARGSYNKGFAAALDWMIKSHLPGESGHELGRVPEQGSNIGVRPAGQTPPTPPPGIAKLQAALTDPQKSAAIKAIVEG